MFNICKDACCNYCELHAGIKLACSGSDHPPWQKVIAACELMLNAHLNTLPMLSRKLSWYAKRLRVMGSAEIAHRVAEQCALKALELRQWVGLTDGESTIGAIDQFSFCTSKARKLPTLPWSFTINDEEAERILRGQLFVLGHQWEWKLDTSAWHQAPDTHREWPQVFFGRIPYREGNPYGDVRIAWEPSRLQHLVTLALLAQDRSPEIRRRAVALIESQILSWVEANPFLIGIHYISVMECGLRILALCHALDLVREWIKNDEQIWRALVVLIKRHAKLIHNRLSVHSSAGNHTVAEAAALVYAGNLFPEIRDAVRWRSVGLSLLEEEASHQILPDGGGAEQSFWYLRFISDLYGLVMMLLRHQQCEVPVSIEHAFQRSQCFLKSVRITRNCVPRVGDGDSGYALSPFLELSEPEGEGSVGLTTFESSGYSVIRAGSGQLQQQVIFDHGPLGMDPCYAHGHADALAVILYVGQREMLVDAGTYTYTGVPEWRNYFRGTRAHNTVVVDGLDQAVQETAFLWAQPFRIGKTLKEEHSDGTVMIVSSHDGYHRRVGVTHWRAVLYQPLTGWLICDRLVGDGEHSLELNWHLGEEPIVSQNGYVLPCGGDALYLVVQCGEPCSLHHEGERPNKGWRSEQYGMREPIYTVRVTYRGALPHEFLTHVCIGKHTPSVDKISLNVSILRRFIDEAQTC